MGRITDPATIDRYYEALVARDPQYLGSYFVGVKTTTIFCIATCRARKPKPENVEFFSELKDALDHGYRPCKVCRPTEHAHEAPPQVLQALHLFRQQPKQKVKDQQLREAGISPELVRRWFSKHYGITFQAFQRMARINGAVEELQAGKTTMTTAFDAGYESLSGFGYTYRKVTGQSPSERDRMPPICLTRLTTPLGPMFVAATEMGVCLLEFVDRRMLETEFRDLQKLLKTTIIMGENAHTHQLQRELEEYFAGHRKGFDVALDLPGTEFQCAVWQALKTIPFGETRSYQQQANYLGKPAAVRAVANANGANRVAIVIPCHRVIGKNGTLTGYGGGLERKRWLLEHEQKSEV